jgi:two-component sensor histidine kinase
LDWTNNPLGPPETWCTALRVAVQMMLASHFPKALVWGPEMITLHNDAFRPILGEKPNAQGVSFRDIWAEAWDDIGDIAARALGGEATFIENFPLTINRHGYDEHCHFTFCYSPVFDETGAVAGFIDTVIETTQTVQALTAMQTLNDELAHRMRNTFAIVTAIARQSVLNAADTDSAWEALSARMGALAEAQKSLATTTHRAAEIRDVILSALCVHMSDQSAVVLDGPAILLPERQSMAMALAINELATNALKHGALAQGGGAIRVEWRREGSGFGLEWSETVPHANGLGKRRGFGLTLLDSIVPADFDGTATLAHSDGLLTYRLDGFLPG